MEIEKLHRIGESLGLSGSELREFIQEEQTRAREVRVEERDRVKRELELTELNLQLERERQRGERDTGASRAHVRPPKLPTFEEGKDNLDTYLNRFERYATANEWPPATWATNLSALLSGKALDTYARLSEEEAVDYEALKEALLKRYDLTSEGFRRKLRAAKPESGETASQFVHRMRGYIDKWLTLGGFQKSYDDVVEIMLIEQFHRSCSKELSMFVREHKPTTLKELARVADRFLEAHSGWNQPQGGKTPVREKSLAPNPNSNIRPKTFNTGSRPPSAPRTGPESANRLGCRICGRIGHFARDCNRRNRPTEKLGAGVVKEERHQERSRDRRTDTMTSDDQPPSSQGPGELRSDVTVRVPRRGDGQVSNPTGSRNEYGCLLIDSCFSCDKGRQMRDERDDLPLMSAACGAQPIRAMPVAEGRVNGASVRVLRDSGCSTAVIRSELVRPEQMTDEWRTCVLIDGTTRRFPVARVSVDTPYFVGTLDVMCMNNPVYPLILGNVPGVRNPADPDEEWMPVELLEAVETRQQRREAARPLRALKVPGQVATVTPDEFRQEQETDPTLDIIRRHVTSGEVKESRNGNTSKFKVKNGLMYREFHCISRGANDISDQLIVPEKFRRQILKLAHESIMGGHLGANKTADKILINFFWPGLQADVQRFCRSCDACQRAIPKGRVTKVPLGSTPVIDEPFHRVAVDLVGPIKPATTRGHRYILTLVDYATRYPEAVPLRNIDTPTVAEALLSIYSRVGFPKEMLTDRGAQFTSDIMREVSRLLSIRHVTTTPYHPQCNGLVERFNGTLKQMLNKMCEERPTDWDRYIDPLLFAYRETPQDSTGFAPFELLYGRVVRGPLMLVKELWTEENTEPETKSTYQFVLDLKEKMEKTCDIARNELLKSHERYRQNYNRKARQRSFKVGDEVLVLLPTDHNKLLMHWKGPFRVVGTVGKLDYRVDLGSRVTTFHANLLRKYIRREEQQEVGAPFEVASTSVVEDEDVNDDDDEERRKISNRMSNENLLHIPAVKRTQSVDDVNIDLTLTEEQHHQARELLQVFDDVLTDVPGITRAGHHDIQLTHNEPIRSKPYPLPHSMRQVVKDEVQEMMTLGVIEHSTSPYASPIVLVKKKDGTNRFCCDFRKLNAATIIDSEPIPDQEEIFAKLAGDRYFTKIDLTKGYWQVPLTERAKPLTAFITPDGLYQFMTMPFGLVNAPATFSRVMRTVLRGLPHVDNFIDDILIHTPTWEGHVEAVTSVLLRLRAANLKAKPSKCLVGYAELEFLGHRLSRGMVQPNHDKIAEIQNAKQPTTKKQLRSFLGLAGYYRKFVPNYAAIAVPLTDLTKKGEPNQIRWGEAQERAFMTLKAKLSYQPILRLPDVSRTFILRTERKGVLNNRERMPRSSMGHS
ncbi:uncharacterized protein [Diadema setosum]|uniref:uncharacterized protein n=1 Tax=Diadema setosum TaxID=31175 RepID=UPI003B3B3D34